MIKKRLQDNIENVLNAIDNVVGYHHVAKRQKDLINKGVQGDLNTYIKSLSEVQSAVEFFAQVGFDKKRHHLIDRFHQPMKSHQFSRACLPHGHFVRIPLAAAKRR